MSELAIAAAPHSMQASATPSAFEPLARLIGVNEAEPCILPMRRADAGDRPGSVTKRLIVERVLNLGSERDGVTYSVHRVAQNAEAAREIGEYLWRKLAPYGIHYLLAPGSGAAPVAAAVGAAALRDGVVLETLHVRDPKRTRDGERLVEGHLPKRPAKAAFVDDVIMRGNTYRQTMETVSRYTDKIDCVAIGLVFDSFHSKGSRALAASGVPLYAVADRREIGLTRDSDRSVTAVISPALWLRARLVQKPQFQRKTIPLVTATEVICGLDDCAVEAYSVEDGSRLWRVDSPINRSKGSSCELLLAESGILYSGNYAGFLTASHQGDILWQVRISHAIHSRPTLVDGRLYQNVEDFDEAPRGRLLCLDATTGKLLWDVPHPNFGPTGVAVADGIAVTAHNNGEMVGVSLDGKKLWTHKMAALFRGRALIHRHKVLYVDEKGHLVKLDLATGEELDRVRFSTSGNHNEPLLVEGVLIVTDGVMHMAGYDPDTLERLWVNRLRGACSWKPAVHKGYLLTQTTDGALAATVAKTGQKVWETKHMWRWGTGPIGLSSTHAAILSLDGRLSFHRLEI